MSDRHVELVAVALISGGGSNLQAIIDAIAENKIAVRLAAVISNKGDAHGLTRATSAGIKAVTVRDADYPDRDQYDAALSATIDQHQPDIIVLAGFMRILTPTFVQRYEGQIVNIHPSLLPKFPGLHTHQRALDNGENDHGCTVHFVTEELDGGPRIIQGSVKVLDGDTASQLAARVLQVEHKIYPQALALIASGHIKYDNGTACLNGEPLPEPVEFEDSARGSKVGTR